MNICTSKISSWQSTMRQWFFKIVTEFILCWTYCWVCGPSKVQLQKANKNQFEKKLICKCLLIGDSLWVGCDVHLCSFSLTASGPPSCPDLCKSFVSCTLQTLCRSYALCHTVCECMCMSILLCLEGLGSSLPSIPSSY